MGISETIRSGTKVLALSNIAVRGVNFIIGIILARLLFPEDFGLVITISVFTGFAGLIATGGMGQALVQAKELEAKNSYTIFTLQLLICTLIFLFFYLLSPYFASWYNEPVYEPLLAVSALSFLIRPFLNVPSSLLQRDEKYAQMGLVNFSAMLISGGISVLMALEGYGVWSLVVSGLIGGIIHIMILFYLTRWLPRLNFEFHTIKKLGTYGAKFSINGILRYLKLKVNNLVISGMLGPAMVGLFNKGESLADLPKDIVLGSTYQTLFRSFSKEQDNDELLKYLYYKAITITSFYLIPIYVMAFFLCEPAVLLLYGEKWAGAVDILKILSLTGLFMFGSHSGALIAAKGALTKEIYLNLETFVLVVIGSMIGVKWGIEGVAIAYLLNRWYVNYRLHMIVSRLIHGNVRDLLWALFPSFLFGGGLACFLWLLESLFPTLQQSYLIHLLSFGVFGLIFYLLCFFLIPVQSLVGEKKRILAFVKIQSSL